MWNKVKAVFLHSLTIAVSFLVCVGGLVINNLDGLSAVISTQDFKDNLAVLVGSDPVILGRWMMVVSIVTMAARLRSIIPWEDLVSWFKGKKDGS